MAQVMASWLIHHESKEKFLKKGLQLGTLV